MTRILQLPMVALAAMSSIFCAITTTLAFNDLDLMWMNLLAGAMTVLYHLLIIILAWHRIHRKRIELCTTSTVSVGLADHPVIPHPTAVTAFSLVILSVWIIAIGITIDVAVEGADNDSSLTPSSSSHIDQTALVASALVDGVEAILIVFFIRCFLKRQKKTDEQERDKLEENIFNPVTPVLTRAGTFGRLKRLYSRQSARSPRMRHSVATTVVSALNNYPPLLKSPKPPITRQNVSPWEMLTPKIPTPDSSPTFTELNIATLPQSPPLTSLQRPPSTFQWK